MSHEYVFHLTKSERYFAAVDEVREEHEASRRDAWDRRGDNADDQTDARMGNNPLGKLPGSVWSIEDDGVPLPTLDELGDDEGEPPVTFELHRADARHLPLVENVEDAPMPYSTVLCGWTFGLPIYRHRRFGSSFLIMAPPHRRHRHTIAPGGANLSARYRAGGGSVGVFTDVGAAEAIGIDWMGEKDLSQAIPPVFTQHIGEQLLHQVAVR